MKRVELLDLIDEYARHRALAETFRALNDLEVSELYIEESRDEFRIISDILLNDYLSEE